MEVLDSTVREFPIALKCRLGVDLGGDVRPFGWR